MLLVCVEWGVLCSLLNHMPEAPTYSKHRGSSAHDVWVAIKVNKKKRKKNEETSLTYLLL